MFEIDYEKLRDTSGALDLSMKTIEQYQHQYMESNQLHLCSSISNCKDSQSTVLDLTMALSAVKKENDYYEEPKLPNNCVQVIPLPSPNSKLTPFEKSDIKISEVISLNNNNEDSQQFEWPSHAFVHSPIGEDLGREMPVIPAFPKMMDGRRICPECQLTFRDTDKARRHYITLHTKIAFNCMFCFAKIKRRDRLRLHLVKNHGFSVEEAQNIASKSNTPFHDKLHGRRSTGTTEKKKKEKEPKRSYDKKRKLATATTLSKTSDGRHLCTVCNISFCALNNAQRHFFSKHSGDIYKCDICGHEMNRRDTWRNHLIKKHDISAEEIDVWK